MLLFHGQPAAVADAAVAAGTAVVTTTLPAVESVADGSSVSVDAKQEYHMAFHVLQ